MEYGTNEVGLVIIIIFVIGMIIAGVNPIEVLKTVIFL